LISVDLLTARSFGRPADFDLDVERLTFFLTAILDSFFARYRLVASRIRLR